MRAVMMLVVMVLTTMTAWADNVNNKMRNYSIGNTYYVTDDETVNECMNVTADMTWIISEGVTLTATEGITIAEGHTLTIGGMGTLIATGQRGANATGGASGNSPMYRNGDNGTAAIIGNIIVNGASVYATGGDGGNGITTTTQGGNGGNAGSGVSGNVTFNGGFIYATGGNGGSGAKGKGGSLFDGYNGAAGKAIDGTVTNAKANLTFMESDDNNTWSIMTEESSNKRFIKVVLTFIANLMATSTIESDCYISDNYTHDNRITVNGDVTLTIAKGVTLTASQGITVANGHTLTIKGLGTLIATGQNGGRGGDGYIIVSGGWQNGRYSPATDGGAGGDGIKGNVIVSGATVYATGGDGGDGGNGGNSQQATSNYRPPATGGMGGNGGVGIRGTVVFNYGSVNTVGGSGGNGGLKGDSGSNGRAGSVGKGIAGTLTYPAAASAQDSNDNSTWSDLTETSSNERYVRFYYRPVIVGDTNGDYEVTVSDAVTIVNYLLGNASDDFDANAADMNHDGHVTISDAVTVVNMATSE